MEHRDPLQEDISLVAVVVPQKLEEPMVQEAMVAVVKVDPLQEVQDQEAMEQ
tara:strand:+ start:2379 stop:2534 length:156 start_codon:yes stop_codon:yes gene_type:complete